MSRNNPFGRIEGRPPQIPLVAIDRFGKLIEPGHLVMFHSGEDLIFEVVSVGPVLNPGIQGGRAIQAVIRSEFPVQFLPATPNRGMVIVGESKARLEAKAGNNGQGSAVAEEQPPSGIVLTDAAFGADRETISGGPVEDDGGPGAEGAPRDLGDTERRPESGRPCGCDPAADWICERHRAEAESGPSFEDSDPPEEH